MDQRGNHLKEYEHDGNNKTLFTCHLSVTSSSNGNIFIVDWLDAGGRGRVVVLGQGGDVLQIYSGNLNINTERKPFKPRSLLTMASESIIVTDMDIHTLYILNSLGQFIIYYTLLDIEIKLPQSLALSSSGHLYIGCTCKHGSQDTYKAKFYELEYFGI
ncbi:unnamed protein product [Mytilus coruscus]|uniref:Uncharacterized protein n=1 Tax=Mytilus coruscus TaxID=42192 RepID=A0A6J8D4Z6_MYTCO|nr:unnamed protein product [Mytilus coruscus]